MEGIRRLGPGAEHLAALDGVAHEALHYDLPTLDLPAYAWCAETLDAAHLCFLNSESTVLADGWLAALLEPLRDPGVGATGATGSYESPHSIIPFRRRRWPAFPNPHLRTNAFALSRDLMRELRWPAVRTKPAAWELESGRDGFTRQVWGRGLRTLVVGRDGRALRARGMAPQRDLPQRRAGQPPRRRQPHAPVGRGRRRPPRAAVAPWRGAPTPRPPRLRRPSGRQRRPDAGQRRVDDHPPAPRRDDAGELRARERGQAQGEAGEDARPRDVRGR